MSSIFENDQLIMQLLLAGAVDRSARNKVAQPAPPQIGNVSRPLPTLGFDPNDDAAVQAEYRKRYQTAPPGYPGRWTPPVGTPTLDGFRQWAKQQAAYKASQEHPTISPQALANYRLAKKLILGIYSQIVTDPADKEHFVQKQAPLTFGAGANPDIKPDNLETLGDFLNWAAANKVMWDGKRISWDYNPGDDTANPAIPPSGADKDEQIPQDAWVFDTYQRDRTHATTRDQFTRQAITKTYYANKNGLLGFLTYLRDSQTAKENKVFEVMIGKVINQINQFLKPQEQIGQRPADPAASQFNDNDLVDGFPSNVLDPKNPYIGTDQFPPRFSAAPIRMTYGDIKSFAALQAWIGGMTLPDKKNPLAPDGNPCPIINILYLRAKYLAGRKDLDRLRPNFSTLEGIYLKNITEFGKQFTFGDQPCAVTTSGTLAPVKPEDKDQQGQGQGQGGGTTNEVTVLNQLVEALPLALSDIDFSRIQTFLGLYGQLVPLAKNNRAAQYRANNMQLQIQHASDGIKAALQQTNGGAVSNFPNMAGLSADDVISWSAPPTSAHSRNLVSQLQIVITSVISLVTDLNTAYGKMLQDNGQSDAINDIRQQLYIGRNNIDKLRNAYQDLPAAGTPGR